MKKLYLALAAIMLIGAFVFGQNINIKNKIPNAPKANKIFRKGSDMPLYKANNNSFPIAQTVIWSETFSNGIPATWTNSGVSDPDAKWVYRGPSTTPNNTSGGKGDCSTGDAILSPTASNGFIIFDSNDYDPTEYCKPSDPNTGTAPSPQIGYLETSAINLSANSSVVLKFYYYGRNYQAAPKVSVSGNGGSTYTDVWTWSLPTNEASANAELVSVNISSVAGGSSNAKIKITWDGDYYEMMIDDISIEVAPAYNLTMLPYISFTDSAQSMYYSKIPKNQAGNWNFSGLIINNGASTATNTKMNINVTKGGTSVFNSNSPGASLNSSDTAIFQVSQTFSPSDTGKYNFTFTASSDSVDSYLIDNVQKDSVIVTDTVFARDFSPYSYAIWAGAFTGVTVSSSYEFGNYFETAKADTASSVTFAITEGIGTSVTGMIYDSSGTLVGQTDFYTITAQDISVSSIKLITIPFPSPVALDPDSWYTVSYADWSGTDSATKILTTGTILTGFGRVPGIMIIDGAPSGILYYPLVRLNTKSVFDPCASFNVASTVTNVSCKGDSTGSISLSATGGNSGYTYLWSNNATSEDITNLVAGTYSVTITDAGGCTKTKSITITQPSTIISTSQLVNSTTTCGASNGSLNGIASGGTSPYTYVWSSGQTTASISGLTSGTYTLTATDSKQCKVITSVTVASSTAVEATTSSVNASCGQQDGSATVTVTAGATPYTYLWSSNAANQITNTASGLGAGAYSVTVTDFGSCTGIFVAGISNTGAPNISVTNSTNITCKGQSTGAIDISVTGGTIPYTYQWSNGIITEDVSGIPAGTYSVNVSGSDSCKAIEVILITEPATGLTATLVSTNVSCKNGSNGSVNLVASGGTGSLTFLWSNNATTEDISGIVAGTYSVTVTDASSCTKTSNINVTEPPALSINSSTTNEIVPPGNNGAINNSVSGGVTPYSFLWSNNSITEDINGLVGGVYTVTVTDANGCTATNTDTLDIIIGITENHETTDFRVFPNPNNGFMNVLFNNAKGKYAIVVRNVIGQIVYSERITLNGNSTRSSIDLSNLGQGIYFLNVSGNEMNKTQKVIIK